MGAENTQEAPAPGTPEYDQAMIAKVDESAAKAVESASADKGLTPAKPERPADVPEQFWDAESGTVKTADLLKALAEAKGTKEEAPADQTKETEKAPEEAAKEAVEAHGIDYNALQSEFDSKGALSEDSYAKLEKIGFDKGTVDAFIAGQQALQAQTLGKAHEAAGGEQNFSQMREWARTGLTSAEQEAFNKAVTTGTEAEMLQAIRGLRSSFESTYGRNPRLLGGSPANGGTAGYASRAEMVADMKDPRYGKDPAFRAKVQSRADLSNF